jgi:hypothetical protein
VDGRFDTEVRRGFNISLLLPRDFLGTGHPHFFQSYFLFTIHDAKVRTLESVVLCGRDRVFSGRSLGPM